MRILIDEEDVRWDAAWEIVVNTFFFTNHTVLPVRVFLYISCWPYHIVIYCWSGSAREVACPFDATFVAEVAACVL
jgi:glucan phosphorylase